MVTLSILSGTGLVAFLVTILILAVIIYGIKLLLEMVSLHPTIVKIIWLIFAVLIIIYLADRFGGQILS